VTGKRVNFIFSEFSVQVEQTQKKENAHLCLYDFSNHFLLLRGCAATG
jgi:hypothetical protein